jgi:cytoskeletal protein CcmA (bactofilin family)
MAVAYRPQVGEQARQASGETGTSVSVIDSHSHFNGLYQTKRDLRIEGTAEGEIECEGTVTVAPSARVTAKVRAHNVVIAGVAAGEITCHDRLTLRPTAELRGEVTAASLSVEEGAFFEGTFEMAAPVASPTKAAETAATPSATRAGLGAGVAANGQHETAVAEAEEDDNEELEGEEEEDDEDE